MPDYSEIVCGGGWVRRVAGDNDQQAQVTQ